MRWFPGEVSEAFFVSQEQVKKLKQLATAREAQGDGWVGKLY